MDLSSAIVNHRRSINYAVSNNEQKTTWTTISFCDSRRHQSRHASLDAFIYYAIVSRFPLMPIETWQLRCNHLLCIFSQFSVMLVETYKLRCMHFLCPSLIYYSTSRSETNFDTDGAITLTVINLVVAILNLTSLCCLIYYLQIRLCQIYVGY